MYYEVGLLGCVEIDALITSLLLLWPETKHDDTAIWTIISVAIVFSIIIYFFYLFNS